MTKSDNTPPPAGRATDSEAATEGEAREGLARVLSSESFRNAPQLSAFLSFVVGRLLAGRAAEIKGYTIAVEALGRPADFDPQDDPIVRVEAGRLRRALAQYYAGDGAGDPIRIAVPVGSYQPIISRHRPPPPPVQPPSGLRWPRPAVLAWLAVPVLLVAALFTDISTLTQKIGPPVAESTNDLFARLGEEAVRKAGATPSTQLPLIYIRIDDMTDASLMELARRYQRTLADALSRFDDAVGVTLRSRDGAIPDYVVEIGALRNGDKVEGVGRVVSVRDGRVLWTSSREREIKNVDTTQDILDSSRRFAANLADPFGVLLLDFAGQTGSAPLRCLFQSLNYRRTMREADHLEARNCLTRALEEDPSFWPGWTQLSFIALEEHSLGFNPLPDPLGRAQKAALVAARLAPASARPLHALMGVEFARGDIEAAFKTGAEALSRNPYDTRLLAGVGSLYVRANRPREGWPLLQRATALSRGRPPFVDFYAFLAAYLMDCPKFTGVHADMLTADGSVLSLLGQALQHVRSGNALGLQAALRRIEQSVPLLDLSAHLRKRGFADSVVERITGDLGIVQSAGLPRFD